MPDYKGLTPHQIVELYKTQDLEKLEMSWMRRDMEDGGVEEEDIQIVLRSVDHEKTKLLHKKDGHARSKTMIYAGVAGLVGSLLLTLFLWREGFVASLSIVGFLGSFLLIARGIALRP